MAEYDKARAVPGFPGQPLLFLAFFTLLYFNLHNHWIVVAAQIQVWRVVCNTLQAGGVEDVVNTQHAFGIAVGVHVSVSGSAESVFEGFPQMMVGVGGRLSLIHI